MTTITLSNQNEHSECLQATIDIGSSQCTLSNHQTIELRKLIHDVDFHHPLLKNKMDEASIYQFHYEYDDINGLLQSAIYVYKMLLNAPNPRMCQFKIKPSAIFQNLNTNDSIYFSIHSDQLAKETIQITQLEKLISELGRYPFKFINSLLIDEELKINDLPSTVDGDFLYEADTNLIKLINQPCVFEAFELRYISPKIGFGVFCRKKITKEEQVCFYGGKKYRSKEANENYAFKHQLDALNMYIDAQKFGNLARFINHAPKPSGHQDPFLLEANLTSATHYLQGIEVVVFSANRDIQPGEQLLVDYGKNFFRARPAYRFTKQTKAIDSIKKIIAYNSTQSIAQLRIMANHGVKSAVRFLLLRALSIAGIIFLMMGVLTQVS